MRRVAGRALDALPRNANTAMVLVRLVLAILLWTAIAFVALEVLTFWMFFVLPIQLVARRGKPAALPPPSWTVSAPAHPTPAAWSLGNPPVPPADPQSLMRRLASAPDPKAESALDRCPVCGAPTRKALDECSYCQSPLPVVAKRGWHPDPLGGPFRRWFDGAIWTEHVTGKD